jgi:hypothetical protein
LHIKISRLYQSSRLDGRSELHLQQTHEASKKLKLVKIKWVHYKNENAMTTLSVTPTEMTVDPQRATRTALSQPS